jgi:hypothetical protein
VRLVYQNSRLTGEFPADQDTVAQVGVLVGELLDEAGEFVTIAARLRE